MTHYTRSPLQSVDNMRKSLLPVSDDGEHVDNEEVVETITITRAEATQGIQQWLTKLDDPLQSPTIAPDFGPWLTLAKYNVLAKEIKRKVTIGGQGHKLGRRP